MAKHGKTRGMRDEMNVGPDPRQARRLVPLKELGRFRVADGEPDIRGWEVYTSTGREMGRVDELLVDTDTNEVVMLDVDLRRDDRHTLAPLRAAWVDHAARRVVIDAKELQGAEEVPSLSRAGATDEDVRRFDEGYARSYGAYHDDDREMRLRHGTGELRFGRRAEDRDRGVERREQVDLDDYRVEDRGERELRMPRRDSDPRSAGTRDEEVVLERRPVVEEVVVRRRVIDDDDRSASDAGRDRDRDGIPDDRERRL